MSERSNPSIWMDHPIEVASGGIDFSAHYDVVVIGAGIVGCSLAYELAASPFKTLLIEANEIASDVTGFTTGKVTAQHGLIYAELIRTFGLENAANYAGANQWAVSRLEEVARLEGIDCDLAREPAHVFSTDPATRGAFVDELDACAKLGLPVTMRDDCGLPVPIAHCLRFEGQARFHPRKYIEAIVKRAIERGVQVAEHHRVLEVQEDDSGCRVRLEGGELACGRVVVATNYPIHDSGLFVAKLAPYMSYAMAMRIQGPAPQGMFISNENEERSLRIQPHNGHDLLIAGAEVHKVGQEEDTALRFEKLESWVRDWFQVNEVLFRWCTQDNRTPDRLPYVGRSPNRKNVYLATGFDGWGMSNGIASARLLRDLLFEVENPWRETYRPDRIEWAAATSLITENLNVAGRLVGDRLRKAEYDNFAALAPGEGGIVQLEDRRVAAYCDAEGGLHAVTSACTHLGCQVAWNNADKTWDCPCHGSRFGVDGDVLHGPAVKPLERYLPTSEFEPAPVPTV